MEQELQEILTEIELLKKLIIALTQKVDDLKRKIDVIQSDVRHLH